MTCSVWCIRYTLLCIAIPQSDVSVKVIEEEELLAEVMD
jgi:hypothetical protein